MKRILPLAALALAPALASAQLITGGRPVDPDRSFSIKASVGKVTEIKGGVAETTRQLFELEGRDPATFEAESYTFEELGLTESEITFGVSLEKVWRYITLRGDASYMRAEARGVPPRDFYIGVSDIEFQGRSYDYMKLEKGIPYEASMDALLINLRMQFTPFTLGADRVVALTPWVHAGIFAIAGTFDVSQGEPKRVQLYEDPPREYVVGGYGEGSLAGLAPEIGIGGEVRLWIGQNRHGDRELALQGTVAMFKYNGSSDALGVSSRNEKDLDVDYAMTELRAVLYWPIGAKTDLVLGAEYKIMTADAESKAKAKSLAEAQQTREKFDKDIDLDLTIVSAFIGLQF